MPTHSSPIALLDDLCTSSSPKLTWYADGDRVELSGSVFGMWVAKTANYLVDDVAVGPGSTVYLDLPVHWRSVVWALGAWCAGASVAFRQLDDVDVVVTDQPTQWADADADVLAVELHALARKYGSELPPMVADATAEVMSAADSLGPMPPTDVRAVAVAGPNLRFHDLDELFAGGTTERIMVQPKNNNELVRSVVAQLVGGGSVVVIDPRYDGADCGLIATQEKARPRAGTACGGR